MANHRRASRRDFLTLAAGVPAALALTARTGRAQSVPLAPTPACPDDGAPTPRQTPGPFYKPDSPRRTSLLEPGMDGTRIVVTGLVVSTECTPVAGALVDFWQADAAGVYDNAGYRLRGHQLTDDQGRYRLETIVPGLYPGRTRHFHVNVQAPHRPVLTTQLYIPREPANERDGLYRPDLLVRLANEAGGAVGTFTFVLDLSGRARRGGRG
jgi:protocatechuate 3,4-dioxygenase beta subunit